MVFESLVADLLNKYLGEYVDNLDGKQLKIGIWGGDVVLKDLSLKESALDDLNLPVKTINGSLGKLTLKIPWKNLYSAPVEASIEDLYILVVPNTEIKYDPDKEEKYRQDVKQALLEKVEEAKKREKEKDKPKPDDTFAEKLATEIVRNIELSIKNVHICYEDRVNTNGKPFALGITLQSIEVRTTNSKWQPSISQEISLMIYKILKVEGFSVYWDSMLKKSFLTLSKRQLYNAFKNKITTNMSVISDCQHMVGPINAISKLQINSKPKTADYTIPKVQFHLELPLLKVRISKNQYQDLLVLLDSFDRMARAAPYRKYRPNVMSYKGNAKVWWKYIYTCVLEEEVLRRRRYWTWIHIQNHRQLCKEYSKAYKQKLTTSKPSADVKNTCQRCEKHLDVLNIVFLRQKIEIGVERNKSLDLRLKKPTGWFSKWWGSDLEEDDLIQNGLMKRLDEAMTPSEKEILFRAIGYQENADPDENPVEFVAMDLNFSLGRLEIEIRDEDSQVLFGVVTNVIARFQERPAAQAIKITVKLEHVMVTGLEQEELKPELVQSRLSMSCLDSLTGPGNPMLHVTFETNPIDGSCDQRVHVTSLPLHVVYDALTINKIVDVFTVEQNAVITQLLTAATLKLEEIKRKSAHGIQYVIQNRSRLELKIKLMGFYGVIPHGGRLTSCNQPQIVAQLSELLFNSKARPEDESTVQKMHKQGTNETDIMKEMLNRSYDRFEMELKEAQVKMILPDELMVSRHIDIPSPTTLPDQNIIKPVNLKIFLDKSILLDDQRIPKIKIYAELPSIILILSETRFLSLIALLMSIPLPEPNKEEELDQAINFFASPTSVTALEIAKVTRICEYTTPLPILDDDMVQFTDLEAKFKITEVLLAVLRKTDGVDVPLGEFQLLSLEAEITQKTSYLDIKLRLGDVSLSQEYNENRIWIINTARAEGIQEYLFVASFCKASEDSPEFHTKHNSVLNLLEIDLSCLNFLVHQEALIDVINWARKLNDEVTEALTKRWPTWSDQSADLVNDNEKNNKMAAQVDMHRNAVVKLLDNIREEGSSRHVRKSENQVVNTIHLKVRANLGEIVLTLQNQLLQIGKFFIKGVKSNVIMKRTYTQIDASMSIFEIIDLRKNTKYPMILSILRNEDALISQVIIYNNIEAHDTDYINASVKTTLACFRVVYLNYFVMSLLDFLNNFTAAQAAILDASAAAAEAAKVNMRQAYNEAFRVRLDITLKAPIVIVPANSMSHDAVLLDFGVLTMLNTFQDCHVANGDTVHKLVIDHLQLKLSNLSISRVKVGDKMEISVECVILEPISFRLTVKRNLSTNCFSTIPSMDISGQLESINLKLTQGDYINIMAVLSQNLGEAPTHTFTNYQWSSTIGPSNDCVGSNDISTSVTALGETVTDIEVHRLKLEEKAIETAKTNIKCDFVFEGLVIDIFKEGVKETFENSRKPTKGDGLARFTLYKLILKCSMLSDGSLTAIAQLLDCRLDDTRSSQIGKINRYMECKTGRKNQRSMFFITLKKKNINIFVEIRVHSYILILNMQHIMELLEFITAGAEDRSKLPPPVYPKSSQGYIASTGTASNHRMGSESMKISISLILEQPDIIIVENMDNINTNAIIMNVEILLKIQVVETDMVINGSLKDFQLFSCYFDPEKRKESKDQILRKVTITIEGSTPQGQGLHIVVKTSNIHLAVSPGTIELLNKILSAAVTDNKHVDDVNKLIDNEDYSNIWKIHKFSDLDHWFLKTEVTEEAEIFDNEDTKDNLDEVCNVTVPSLVVTLEAGVGTKSLPMLMMESKVQSNIYNWSSNFYVDSTMSLEVFYFNRRLALWEPLLEPVESKTTPSENIPWQLSIQIESNEFKSKANVDIVGGITDILNAKPKMVVTFNSQETMEITVTKTSLDVLKTLGTAFNNAIFKPDMKSTEESAPFVVKNDLGVNVTIVLTGTGFRIYKPEQQNCEPGKAVLESGTRVHLCLVEDDVQSLVVQRKGSLVKEKYLHIIVPDMICELDLPIVKADKRYFALKSWGQENYSWGLVSDVQVQDGSTCIYLRSILQVQNHFSIPVNVYIMTKQGDEVEQVGTIEPKEYLNLPIKAVYTPNNELFFSTEESTLSLTPFVWKCLQKPHTSTHKVLQCDVKSKHNKQPFLFKVSSEVEEIFYELSSRHSIISTCYNIHLRPTVVIKNYLPVDIIVCSQDVFMEMHVPPGQRLDLVTTEPGRSTIVIRITDYLDKDWYCKHAIAANPPELAVWTFKPCDTKHRLTLDLGMYCNSENESLQLSIYCPFWIINKTGLLLTYWKSSKTWKETSSTNHEEKLDGFNNVLYHPPHYKGPILFSYHANNFWGKNTVSIMVENSEWSEKFSLNAAGSSGYVICKADGMMYKIGVQIQLTYNSLTKQVTFTPYFVLLNRHNLPIEIQFASRLTEPWIRVEPGEVSPFWPKVEDDMSSEIVVKIEDSPETTIPFPYNCTLNCLLKLDNKHGGVHIDIQVTEVAVYITFFNYRTGMAPALIINHSSHEILLAEYAKENFTLPASHKVLFNWSTVTKQHLITWCEKYSADIRKDGIGEFNVSPAIKLFWISFLDGMQRVLLFTHSAKIARDAELAGEMEIFDRELLVCFHGLGLSLIDNLARKDVLYIGITNSGIIWEAKKHGGSNFKPIPQNTSYLIEIAWTLYMQEILFGSQPNSNVNVGDYLIDFANMSIQKPQHKKLRRTCKHGLWIQLKTSPHQWQIHAKVNWLQMDNQDYDCVFPVVFAPVPPPKSVNKRKSIKPFAEVSIVQRVNDHSTVQQYKYFKVLIQECHVKVDIGFINALVKMFEAEATTDEQEAEYFQDDLSLVDKSLISHVELLMSQERKNFYDYLHFSPLKIHLSFSLSGGGVQAQTQMPRLCNLFVQSLGVTLTDIHDVVIKLSYFERTYTFLNQKQMQTEVLMHYRGQLIKQLYVLVLGLDCLGNPFGLVVGIKEGVQDLFYEPFQGAIQGPGEFAEGLVLGVRSLLSNTVGGAAGAVSRITGAFGKGLAALTFDEDYQRNRREAINNPSTVREDLAESSKGLVMGVVQGIEGVFTKPISGAREEGMTGFFKGVGKGMVGLATRPIAGVIDFASGSLNAVKRAAGTEEEVKRLRNPRCFHFDNLVRPYCKLEADGNKLINDLGKRKYYSSDVYVYHTKIGTNKSCDILLLTDKRLIVVSRNEIFGRNEVGFEYSWSEMTEPPTLHPKGIQIKVGEGRKKMSRSLEKSKVIYIEDVDLRRMLIEKITSLLIKIRRTGSKTRQGTVTFKNSTK